MRNTPQENILLQVVHVAHEKVMLKKDEVQKTNEQLKSMQPVQRTIARLIACKEHWEEQVVQPI